MNLQEIRIHGFVHAFATIHWFSVSDIRVFSCLCFCLLMPMLKYGTEMFKKKQHGVFLLMRFHPRRFCVSQCTQVSMQESKNKSSQNSLRSQKRYFDPFRYGHRDLFCPLQWHRTSCNGNPTEGLPRGNRKPFGVYLLVDTTKKNQKVFSENHIP